MFKDKIKEVRLKNKITIQELSKLTGLSLASISMYESGKRIPSAENIHKIANALNISIDELFEEKSNRNEHYNSIIKNKANDFLLKKAFIRANGICELCGENAPFITEEGEPYLVGKSIYYEEINDTYIFAVCPNCHEKLSVLKCTGEKIYLRKKYNQQI